MPGHAVKGQLAEGGQRRRAFAVLDHAKDAPQLGRAERKIAAVK